MADSDKAKNNPGGKLVRRPRLLVPKKLDSVYSNVVRIAHTPSEIVFDFGQILPGDRDASIKARVMMTPLSAKLLHRALTENLARYEGKFGEVQVPQGQSLADQLFRSLHNPDGPEGSEEADDSSEPDEPKQE